MTQHSPDLQADLDAISKIDAVPSILKVLCRTTGMGFAAVARVTESRWIACAVEDQIQFGLLPGGELSLETTICNEIRQHLKTVVFNHASQNEAYRNHQTPLMYGIESYLSVPIITQSGKFFGTLCAIDPRPADVENKETIKMFELYAELIAFHLHAVEQKDLSDIKLREEQENAELREQFIAILGHDMRNPASAVAQAAQLMLEMPLEIPVMQLVHIVQNASYRMKGLIDNIMDFAQGRLGKGISVDRKEVCIAEMLDQVIAELRLTWPQRVIEQKLDLPATVYCDSLRLAQLCSNLLGNAIIHGRQDMPVQLEAYIRDGHFVLSVSNPGRQIPDTVRERLFQPFYRGEAQFHRQQGLGLGLYISSEIARAHGGTLTVSSTPEETRFTLTIPDGRNAH